MKALRIIVAILSICVIGEWFWVLASTISEDVERGEVGYFGVIAAVFSPMLVLGILSLVLAIVGGKKDAR